MEPSPDRSPAGGARRRLGVAACTIRLRVLLAALLVPWACAEEAAPPVAPDASTEAVRASPTGRELLLVRDRLTSPPACGGLLREGDLAAWQACREELQEQGGSWPATALLVLGCFDPAARAWHDAGDCLPLVEPVLSAAGSAVGLEDPAPVLCEASGDWAEGLPARFPEGDDSRFAATTAGLDSLRLLAPGPGPPLAAELRLGLAAAVERDVGEGAPPAGGPLQIDQVVEADLDGDGRTDRLIAARIPSVEQIYHRFSGLYLLRGAASDLPVLLMSSQIERFRVPATCDLDRDGSLEIVVQPTYYEGSYTYLYRFAGDDLVMLGGWGCGA